MRRLLFVFIAHSCVQSLFQSEDAFVKRLADDDAIHAVFFNLFQGVNVVQRSNSAGSRDMQTAGFGNFAEMSV